ncbi:hypothetical protein SEMRO_4089_G352830.1 [Seminavis robusta]|uniref:Uncharacterized protein n=1 Tax=Seminavis robusta TaxID=568900 RepID=A0A9N8HZS9_9STRA|nr:hypothetical protein SEMRO_4089_G352830.1 [Seminavis robusta]|eukprot:Sro4089_g352830.1 n/a (209) ;mRNA; r:1495-2218
MHMASTITTQSKTQANRQATRVRGVQFTNELIKGSCEKISGKEWRKQQTKKRIENRKIEERKIVVAEANRLVSYLEKVDTDKDFFFAELKPEIDAIKQHYKDNYEAWRTVRATSATAGGTAATGGTTAAGTSAAGGTATPGGNAATGGASEWTPLEVKIMGGGRKALAEISDLHFISYLKSLDKRFEKNSDLGYIGILENRAVELSCC